VKRLVHDGLWRWVEIDTVMTQILAARRAGAGGSSSAAAHADRQRHLPQEDPSLGFDHGDRVHWVAAELSPTG
jgi:hypothetical protein